MQFSQEPHNPAWLQRHTSVILRHRPRCLLFHGCVKGTTDTPATAIILSLFCLRSIQDKLLSKRVPHAHPPSPPSCLPSPDPAAAPSPPAADSVSPARKVVSLDHRLPTPACSELFSGSIWSPTSGARLGRDGSLLDAVQRP